MDGDRFDNISRALACGTSRRAVLRGLAGSLAAGLIGLRASSGVAQSRQPNGTACTRASQCQSFKCVDGICCNATCTGQCESCAFGACLPVVGAPVGNRPACSGSGVCRGTCDGVQRSSCAVYPGLDVVCADPICEGGWQTTYGCGGNGTCHPTTTSCGLFLCNPEGSACLTACRGNDDCVGGAHCADGVCQGDKGPGESCASADECQLGFCVNGVCCTEACDGACETCGTDGFCGERDCAELDDTCVVGVCNPSTGACETGSADDGASCDGGRCCGGACVDTNANLAHCGGCNNPCPEPENNPCQVAACRNGTCDLAPGNGGTICLEPQCVDDGRGVLSGVCDGVHGLCEQETEECAPFRCDTATATCLTSCATDDDCLDETSCCDGNCVDNLCCPEPQADCPILDLSTGFSTVCCGPDETCTRFEVPLPEGSGELGICCPATREACRLLEPFDGDFGLTCCSDGEACITTTIGTPLGDIEVGVCCPPGGTTCLVTSTSGQATGFECCAPGDVCTGVTFGSLSADVGCCPPDVAGCLVGPAQEPALLQPACCGTEEICALVPTGPLTADLACCPVADACTILGTTLCCEEGTGCALQGADPPLPSCCPTERLCFFDSIGVDVCCPEGTSCNGAASLCE